MNVKRYIIDYSKYVLQRISVEFRFSEVIAYAMVIVQPIIYVYNSLITHRNLLIYKLTITPQVVYLEKLLNDRYDDASRRIYIMDGNEYDPLYLYAKAELKPMTIYTKSEVSKPKKFMFLRGESGEFPYDFIVYVPVDIVFDETEMTALVNGYKLAGMLFKIQTF